MAETPTGCDPTTHSGTEALDEFADSKSMRTVCLLQRASSGPEISPTSSPVGFSVAWASSSS
ncbi:MAG: hypothetical protein AB7U20_09150, partial [Planctomycetaceae bacterium]